eukprot:11176006-Lingulodinium_polyedra.AAC.1
MRRGALVGLRPSIDGYAGPPRSRLTPSQSWALAFPFPGRKPLQRCAATDCLLKTGSCSGRFPLTSWSHVDSHGI